MLFDPSKWSIPGKYIIPIVVATATATAGWFSLKNDVAEAKTKYTSLDQRVARIECLIEQANQFQIYGIKPTQRCD
jgi:hypothetical protein